MSANRLKVLCCRPFRLVTRKGVVLAAGAWSGHLLSTATGDDKWQDVFKPRRGHLLELQLPAGMPPLRHGLMEMGYTQVTHTPAFLGRLGGIVHTHAACAA